MLQSAAVHSDIIIHVIFDLQLSEVDESVLTFTPHHHIRTSLLMLHMELSMLTLGTFMVLFWESEESTGCVGKTHLSFPSKHSPQAISSLLQMACLTRGMFIHFRPIDNQVSLSMYHIYATYSLVECEVTNTLCYKFTTFYLLRYPLIQVV